MHRFWAPLARFCRDLEWALGHPTQVNAYVTPAGARGLAVHEDAHDVFVLQAFGSKHWNVWDTRAGVDRAKSGRAKPVITQTLEPGDTLYLPRLTPHAAEAQAQASGHLTIGIPAITWLVVLRRALAGMDQEERLDAPLPVGVHQDPAGLAAGIEDRLKEVRAWMERLDGEDLAAREIRRFLTTRPSLTDGGLRDLVALGSVGDATPLRRRPGSICVLETAEDALVVLLGDRELRMPARLRPAMEELSGLAHLTAGDLEEHLDEAGRLTLVRRLIREGLLEVVR
jgi:hypothetical protein